MVEAIAKPGARRAERKGRAVASKAESVEKVAPLRKQLDTALVKLEKEIIPALAENSRERLRARHTLDSVKYTLKNLEKNGPNKGKYAVAVEDMEGNPAYAQFEGVPVDELINILRDRAAIMLTPPITEEDKKLALRENYQKSAKELSELADILQKNSIGYFEAHYTKGHGEGGHWTKEEEARQNLRTRHEAKLISLDYRRSTNPDHEQRLKEDYAASKEVLKYRRELVLDEKEETKPPPTPEKRRNVAIVDANAQVELMARTRGVELLNQKLRYGNWLKRKWTHMWEEGYRQQLINEERKQILGQENRPGFIRRVFFGARGFEATGKKNLFAGTASESQNEAELASLAARFAEDLHRESEHESKTILRDVGFNARINDLIHSFASSGMSEADFNKSKNALIEEISKAHPKIFAEGGLTADNLLEAARDFRGIYTNAGNLARTDVNLQVDLGLAKQAIKTEANLNWADKVVGFTQKYAGAIASPEGIGFATAIGIYFSRSPLGSLLGAAGLGGLFGAMRKNAEQKKDLAMHRVERAIGAGKQGPDAVRRSAVERFVHEMRPAAEIVKEVRALSEDFKANPSQQTAGALTKALADAEARHSVSETRSCDLISFSGETTLERCRLDFMRALAEAKISLKGAGYESNIENTNEYKTALHSFNDNVDAVNKSEKKHRWTENGKAAVIGAVGGLVAGAAAQEALALVGDNVSFLHWLRPGGKATSAESLANYIWNHGNPLTAPTGAGFQQFAGLVPSGGVIKIDGTTELIPGTSTGLMNLVDKADHSRILAQMNIDPAGRVIPVPNSYDPNLITFHDSKTSGGTQTLQGWLQSMKGNFGGNVAEDTWHTKRWLDNDTPSPSQAEFNELRLHMGFDKSGNLTIDASKLREYMQNAAGTQIEGSAHGGSTLNVADAFAKGTIKIGLAPDGANPHSILELKYDPATQKCIVPKGSPAMNFFDVDAKGRAVLKGDGFMGIVHEFGVQQDGSKNVEWVNSIRGNGEAIETGEGDRWVTEIGRRNPVEWWGPWFWSYKRRPLEEMKTEKSRKPVTKDTIVDETGKEVEPKPGRFEEPKIDEGKKIRGKKDLKVREETRGQGIIKDVDTKDWGAEYPEKFPLMDEKQMANFLVRRGGFVMTAGDREKFISLDITGRVAFLEERIKKDRAFLEIGNGRGLNKQALDSIVDTVLKHANAVFDKYSGEKKEGRSQLPAKERIHVVGMLEYQAQTMSVGSTEIYNGVMFSDSGEIFVNFDAIKSDLSDNGRIPVDENVMISSLKRVISHEVTHDTVANNYWMFDIGNLGTTTVPRRTGIRFFRREALPGGNIITDPSGPQVIIGRGMALNEAITEELGKETTNAIYKEEGTQAPSGTGEAYVNERGVLKLLQEKFKMPFDDFAKAVVNRRALGGLARQLNSRKVEITTDGKRIVISERPQFMSLLLSIMDHEFNDDKRDYPFTKQLIKGSGEILITRQMKSGFASSLLEGGALKTSLVEAYEKQGLLLIDEEYAKKQRAAA